MNKHITAIILVILFIGIVYRLFLTANGNFLFNMDNARDMVDVREMVVLGKLRLIGPTSAIEGFFNGPAWYYLLSIPFLLSQGDPYAAVLLQMALWIIGGFFLLKLVSRFGSWVVLPIGALWVAADYIVLANVYAFNPNPVTLLAPLFIYLLISYLETKQAIYGISMWMLAGLFFNCEMNFGVFTPLIIFSSIVLTKNNHLLKQKWFWVGISLFLLTLLPQVLFDIKYQFIMSRAILRHLSENTGMPWDILNRFKGISMSFYNTFLPTLVNNRLLTGAILLFSIPIIYNFFRERKKDELVSVSLIFITVPFLGYLVLPITVNPWHLGGEMAVSLILVGYLLKKLMDGIFLSKVIAVILSFSIIWVVVFRVDSFFINEWNKLSMDPSSYKSEIAAIDYVYQKAAGKNFKVYIFLPSVYDYPYQYLFWWYGKRKYGYIPAEYAYAPNKPLYISNKDKFAGSEDNYDGLVFLIKEPNRGYDWKSGWEASYKSMELLFADKIGSIEIEARRELHR